MVNNITILQILQVVMMACSGSAWKKSYGSNHVYHPQSLPFVKMNSLGDMTAVTEVELTFNKMNTTQSLQLTDLAATLVNEKENVMVNLTAVIVALKEELRNNSRTFHVVTKSLKDDLLSVNTTLSKFKDDMQSLITSLKGQMNSRSSRKVCRLQMINTSSTA
jgi:hypothetical protein